MKKILALLSLLTAVAACTAPTETTNTAPTTNANMMATKPAVTMLSEADAIAKEKAAWDALKNKDYDGFGAMLATDVINVSSTGIDDKAATIDGLKGFQPTELTFSDWKVVPIGKTGAVVSYTAAVTIMAEGKPAPPESFRATTAWVNRDGKWLAVYHQDSPVKPPMPAPKTPPAKPAASPTTPAAVVTSDNVEANEKAIWDALKTKNFDGFASALAPESYEVEPDGTYDKAASVKAVQSFDFSKAALSDFRTVKLGDDASLVIYLVKIPGGPPDGERHSTIWVNHDGKWLATFHQGTPVEKRPTPPPAKAGASPAMKPSTTK
jgi:hypothetical protein